MHVFSLWTLKVVLIKQVSARLVSLDTKSGTDQAVVSACLLSLDTKSVTDQTGQCNVLVSLDTKSGTDHCTSRLSKRGTDHCTSRLSGHQVVLTKQVSVSLDTKSGTDHYRSVDISSLWTLTVVLIKQVSARLVSLDTKSGTDHYKSVHVFSLWLTSASVKSGSDQTGRCSGWYALYLSATPVWVEQYIQK